MAGQLPTRRAFRPDSQYYRTSRRLGLARRNGGRGTGAESWMLASVLVALAVTGFWWGHHGGLWAGVFGYGTMIIAALGAIAIVVRR